MADANGADRHEGVKMTGKDGADGPKAFLILIEAKPGKEQEVIRMLADIRECVETEPATGPWYAVQLSETSFAIYEVFPDIAGRDAHIAGGGGEIFRDVERMNSILSKLAHVQKVDILLSKKLFA
ncbi:MAG: hypothetical protein GYB49_16205 [Alphaproteobacteria bacterium]|nr:hypothetical protein [Hyphomonas sp.]MBR9808758.1 hypothetical protein [Alphaproteobacteria bacterium]|tara:strand:- start:12325 stop:12699 length:375 start_codon:yes stop_codon:yes gene_type:complete